MGKKMYHTLQLVVRSCTVWLRGADNTGDYYAGRANAVIGKQHAADRAGNGKS